MYFRYMYASEGFVRNFRDFDESIREEDQLTTVLLASYSEKGVNAVLGVGCPDIECGDINFFQGWEYRAGSTTSVQLSCRIYTEQPGSYGHHRSEVQRISNRLRGSFTTKFRIEYESYGEKSSGLSSEIVEPANEIRSKSQ